MKALAPSSPPVFLLLRHFGIPPFRVKFVAHRLCMAPLCMPEWLTWCRDPSIPIPLLWTSLVSRLDGGDTVTT